MGSIMSAIRDDDDEWGNLRVHAGINQVWWTVYSQEAVFAKEGFYKHKLQGTDLINYVYSEMAKHLAKVADRAKDARRKQYLELKAEFENEPV